MYRLLTNAKKKRQSFPVKKKKKKSALGETRTNALELPPTLLSHRLAIVLPRINKVTFYYFNVDMRKKRWKDRANAFTVHFDNPFITLRAFTG